MPFIKSGQVWAISRNPPRAPELIFIWHQYVAKARAISSRSGLPGCPSGSSASVLDSEDGATTFGDYARVSVEELQQAVTTCLDAELIHPVAQRIGMKVQYLRRTLWTIYHPTGMLKGGEDMVSVYLFER
jgi:hypothetical protein